MTLNKPPGCAPREGWVHRCPPQAASPALAGAAAVTGEQAGMVLVAAKETPAELCAKYGYELLTVRPDPLGVRVV